jgi:hypothetical protein
MKRLFILLVITSILFAHDISVFTDAEDKELYIGDRIRIRYSFEIPRDMIFHAADAGFLIEDAEVLDQNFRVRKRRDKQFVDWDLEIVAFDTGYVSIPAMPVGLEDSGGSIDTILTPKKYFYIRTVLDADAAPVAMNPPLPLRLMSWWQYMIAGILLGAALFFVWYAIKQSRKQDTGHKPFLITPYEKVRYDLNVLRSKKYPERGEWKLFYVELTHILRAFYENIYFIHLQELTTSELLPVLESLLPETEHRDISSLFHYADLIKFARSTANEAQCKEHFELVERIVTEKEKENNETEPMA